jgi:hypothetical protein
MRAFRYAGREFIISRGGFDGLLLSVFLVQSSVTLPSLPRLNVDKGASLPLPNIVSAIIEHSGICVALKKPVQGRPGNSQRSR